MKTFLITAAVLLSFIVINYSVSSDNTPLPDIQPDTLYACGWFPLCTDPDNSTPKSLIKEQQKVQNTERIA